MFEHADFVSWALAAVGFGYGVWVDSLARKKTRYCARRASLTQTQHPEAQIGMRLLLQSMTFWKN